VVDRSTPLGNPFPIGPNASRAQVCDACDAIFSKGLSVEKAAVLPSGFGLSFAPHLSLSGVAAHADRWSAIDTLARRVAQGEAITLLCVCAPKRCHASSIAACIRKRACVFLAERG
jgi:hypothetical protein